MHLSFNMHRLVKRLSLTFKRASVNVSFQRVSGVRFVSGSFVPVGVFDDKVLKEELCQHIEYNNSNSCQFNIGILTHLMDFFTDRRALPKEFVNRLLDYSLKHQLTLPNILRINRIRLPENRNVFQSDLTIAGDVHGQYDDFAQIFQQRDLGGFPTELNQFLFNGDMVDRGDMGLEIMTVLLVGQLLCPGSVHILRGNHETRWMNQLLGFQKEVESKYDVFTFDKFSLLFEALPVAAVVEDGIFVTHGGIGPRLQQQESLEEIDALDRTAVVHENNVLHELMWNDPSGEPGFTRTGRATGFGADVTKQFLAKHGLRLLVRSHEMKEQGFEMTHDGQCCTVFSAPNYCGRGDNFGAVMRFTCSASMDPTVVYFKSVRGMEKSLLPPPLSL